MSEETKQPEAAIIDKTESAGEPSQDKIDYAKYRELLDEKKKIAAKLADHEKMVRSMEETKLAEEKRYKELFEKRESELQALQAKVEMEKGNSEKAKRTQAILSQLQIKDSYASLFQLDKIIIESDGSINKESLADYVNSFKKEFPELCGKAPTKLPEKTPTHQSSSRKMSSKDILDQLKKR